jgi:DNA-binding NtrC family response regulator
VISKGKREHRARRTILVVEDEALIRLDISEALRRFGFNVIEAANADEALRILQSGVPVSVVFTDVKMPGSMDGIGLTLHIHRRYPATRCVITSGHISAAGLPGLPDPLIAKPYRHDTVLEEIERHLLHMPDERSSEAN